MRNLKLSSLAALGSILTAAGFAFAGNTAYSQLTNTGDFHPPAAPAPSFGGTKSIYGENSMHEYYQVPEQLRKLADSTVAFVPKGGLYFDPVAKVYKIKATERISDFYYADESEDFSSQNKLSGCSGSYLGKGLVMTAGHCISGEKQDPKYFENFLLVFGWKYENEGSPALEFPPDAVYSVKKVETRAFEGLGGNMSAYKDFALVSLDRDPAGRQPLLLEKEQPPAAGQKVFTIGYPLGLAVKINDPDQAQVFKVRDNIFQTNIDAFGGNSGGPAFDSATNKIVGIVVTAVGPEYSYVLSQDFSFIVEFTLPTDSVEYKPHLGTVSYGTAVKDIALKLLGAQQAVIAPIEENRYLVTMPKGAAFENRSLQFKTVTGVGGINVFNRGKLMRDSQDSFGTGVMRLPDEIKNLVTP